MPERVNTANSWKSRIEDSRAGSANSQTSSRKQRKKEREEEKKKAIEAPKESYRRIYRNSNAESSRNVAGEDDEIQ